MHPYNTQDALSTLCYQEFGCEVAQPPDAACWELAHQPCLLHLSKRVLAALSPTALPDIMEWDVPGNLRVRWGRTTTTIAAAPLLSSLFAFRCSRANVSLQASLVGWIDRIDSVLGLCEE